MGFLKSLFNLTPEPDFYFAAQGYVGVAVMKRDGREEPYLRKVERAYGLKLLQDGCNEHQAMSARWGGCLAIEDDLILFDAAIRRGRAEAQARGPVEDEDAEVAKEIYRTIYQNAGDFATRCAWERDPTIYRRFLRHFK